MPSLLNKINSPADLRRLSRADLGALAGELRAFVLNTVSHQLAVLSFGKAFHQINVLTV